MTQLSLFAPPPDDPNIKWLESLLESRAALLTAAQVLAAAGQDDADWRRRSVRALAQASDWIISGQRGYKHLAHATAEEASHFVGWMESQARLMTQRAERVRRNAHRIFG